MNKVKGYRVMCGISQIEMAEFLGISRRTYIEREADGKFTTKQANTFLKKIQEKNPNIRYEDIFLQ